MEHVKIKNSPCLTSGRKIEDLKNVSSFSHVPYSTCTSKIYRRSMLYKNSQMSNVNCSKLNKAFTLLELLLVIAIISVLAGLIIFNLRPAEVLQRTNDAKNVANSKDIKKAIEAYILDHSGNLPTSLQGQPSGE